MIKKYTLTLLVLVLVMAIVATGCSSATPTPEEKAEEKPTKEYTIAVFMPNGGDPYFQNKSYGYVQGADLLNATQQDAKVNVELNDAGGYDQAEKQISQIEDAMQRGVNAIIVTATDKQALVPVIDKAMAAGIPVVNDDVLVATKTTTQISENSCHVGRNAAEYIARKLNGKGGVIMLKGAPGAFLFTERARCAKEEFARYPDMQVLADDFHMVNIEEGRRLTDDWVQAYGKDIKGVWSTNSTVAIGAVEALKAAGFQKDDTVVVAIDLHPEAIKYMEEGWIDGLVPAQPVKLARMAVQYAFAALQGNKIPDVLYTTDDMVVDAEMLPTFDQSDAVAPEGWKPPLR